jgi:hypothetical protein
MIYKPNKFNNKKRIYKLKEEIWKEKNLLLEMNIKSFKLYIKNLLKH